MYSPRHLREIVFDDHRDEVKDSVVERWLGFHWHVDPEIEEDEEFDGREEYQTAEQHEQDDGDTHDTVASGEL